MSFLEANSERVFYKTMGQGDPLVFVAGFTVDHSVWTGIAERLASHFTVLLIDNRGVGQSDTPDYPYSIEMMAQDTISVIEKVFGKTKVNVVGQSMGGAIVQTLARLYPTHIKKAVIANSFPYLSAAFRFVSEFKLELFERGVERDLIEQCAVPWAFSNNFLEIPNVVSEIRSACRTQPAMQSETGYRRQWDALSKFNSLEWLHEIEVPCQIIAAECDIISTVAESEVLHRLIPNSTMRVMPAVGHASQIEQPDEFAGLLTEFLVTKEKDESRV